MPSDPSTGTGAAPTDNGVAALSYEQAREQLADVVRRLEAGGIPLEESLALWERGEQLADRCQAWLDGAREKLARAMAAREETAPGE
jgi:exodeoxyribonuclease VII small subunit